jgi:hypothetical protein
LGLELGSWPIAEALVQSGVVEPAEVLHDGQLELGAGAPDAVGDQLGLEAAKIAPRESKDLHSASAADDAERVERAFAIGDHAQATSWPGGTVAS